MKRILALVLAVWPLLTYGQNGLLQDLKARHPRLLVPDTTWCDLQSERKTSPVLDRLLGKLEADGRAMLPEPPLTRTATDKKAGQDMLRAEQEMRAVAAFSDWDPPHFLDVAEMTAGVSLGYDWLYDALSPDAAATIRQAIIEKGLKPGANADPPANHWAKIKNNWSVALPAQP